LAVKHGARKRFGQNFLVDEQAIGDILAAVAPRPGELIFEIGPGNGALTRPLAESGARVIAVEIDRDLAARLQAADPEFLVLNQDALQVGFADLADGQPYRLVGNLPYNISTPLLFHLLGQPTPPVDLHFMLQKEVVNRLAADPGGKSYGRLSLMVQNRCEVIPLFELGPEAFEPRPKVDSAFVRLVPRPMPLVEDSLQEAFDLLVTQAFSQRRKTLRNSLRSLLTRTDIENAGIAPTARPEQLDLREFLRLARQLQPKP
jgi:16S rRNA (adenine1518-N6/adenine1519-N6)-dimethyltransferase